jgi:hypothetical protein
MGPMSIPLPPLETWRQIDEFPGYYISSIGRVMGKRGILSPHLNHKGYLRVTLVDGYSKKNRRVSRLVALAFIPNEGGKPEVNHKDKIKTNNLWTNLEWMTSEENILHSNA